MPPPLVLGRTQGPTWEFKPPAANLPSPWMLWMLPVLASALQIGSGDNNRLLSSREALPIWLVSM